MSEQTINQNDVKNTLPDDLNTQNQTDLSSSILNVPKEDNIVKTDEDIKYVVLMETSGEECESWYYCIRYNGNEKNLNHLQEQLETVDWYILDDLSTFDLDLEHFICEKTAKELTKLELNHHSFHRKFDGELKQININLRKKDKNEKKMVKVFDILGYGQIEDYIDKEDIDPEDLTDTPQSSTESESTDSESSDSVEHESEELSKNKIPTSLKNIKLPSNKK